MDFENSSQARSWLFDNVTLMQCRQKALTERPKGSSSLDRVRRFASGYHRRHADTAENFDPPHTNRRVSSESLTAEEQEMLVRFHAKQITQLIGPMAVLNGLVRNSTILATAIMLFRRFYVSNSVLDYEPRRVAVAAAYLASKVEEQRVELSLLERATELIEHKLVASSLGKQESYHVTVKDIEAGERELMEGINYEMQCHHPYTAIRVLAKEMSHFLLDYEEERDDCDNIEASPRHVHDFDKAERQRNLFEDSIEVAQNALLFSDVPFLFSPGPIAFASVAIASRNGRKPTRNVDGHTSPLEPQVREFLRVRFPAEQEYDLRDFESQVGKIVAVTDDIRTVIDSNMLMSCQSEELESCDDKTIQIFELRRVSCKVAALRLSRQAVRSRRGRYQSPRKRKGNAEESLIVKDKVEIGKIPKVTPIRLC